MKNILDITKMIFFPPRCVFCRKLCPNDLCLKCKSDIVRKFNPTIAKTIHKNVICASSFVYDGRIKEIIHMYKFRNQKSLFKIFVPFMIESINEKFKDIKFDLVTSVPIYISSLNDRGYNQSQIIGSEIAKNLNIPYENCIGKVKQNKVQHGLSFVERQENVKGVYKVTKDYKGKNILLCDDIITTGATLSECVKKLENSGANVFCVTISYTLKGSFNEQRNHSSV